jgi:chromate reductase
VKILAVSGSLRPDSWNRKVLENAASLFPAGTEFELYDGLKAVPPYDERDDVDPAPATVAELRDMVAGADAVLFSTPEYNSSVPGALKNALDWVSRPLATNSIRNKPVAVVGAGTGAFGAVWAQAELRKVLAAMGARVVQDGVGFGHAPTRFDGSGQLVDDDLREELAEVIEELVTTVRARELLAA